MSETTLLAEPARSAPAGRGPDPDAPAFRAEMAQLRDDVQRHVSAVFEWVDRSLETGERRGEIAAVLALADAADGRMLSHVAADLLYAADTHMSCPRMDDPACRCAFCAYGPGTEDLIVAEGFAGHVGAFLDAEENAAGSVWRWSWPTKKLT